MAGLPTKKIKECPRFCPSEEEFRHPLLYLRKIKSQAENAGICVIHPPVAATESAAAVLKRKNFRFPTRVIPLKRACRESRKELHFYDGESDTSLQEFEILARNFARKVLQSSAVFAPQAMESLYWKEMASDNELEVSYGTDVDGSAFSNSPNDPLGSSDWNLNKLPRLAESLLRHEGGTIPGVTDPMLYVGMLFSSFAWHVEDHYLYSINYHHMGAAKTWYGVGEKDALKLEKMAQERVFGGASECSAAETYTLLIGKATMFSPDLLLQEGVSVYRAVQQAGDFVITFPRGYHAGFSHGFNLGEAVNFAMVEWLELGASALRRYSLLTRPAIIPHVAYLCLELEAGMKDEGREEVVTAKAAFVRLFLQMEWRVEQMQQSGGRVEKRNVRHSFLPAPECYRCKTICHLAVVTCHCPGVGPVCLHHDRPECSCEKVTVSYREDWVRWNKRAVVWKEEPRVKLLLEKPLPVDWAEAVRADAHPSCPNTPPPVGNKRKGGQRKGKEERQGGGEKRIKRESGGEI